MKNAIVLCSGGLDSSVTAYFVKKKLNYKKMIVLFFDYSQRPLKQERKASKNVAKKFGAGVIKISLPELAEISTSLINKSKKARKIKRKELKDTKGESNKYYVPCRNIVFRSEERRV